MLVDTRIYGDLLRAGNRGEALRKSVNDFVATIFYDIFKKMWDSIPRSDLIPETNAEKWYREMLLYEYSKRLAERDFKDLTEMIYEHLSRKVYGNGNTRPSGSKENQLEALRLGGRSEGHEYDHNSPR